MIWARAFAVWIAIIAAETAHGIARVLLLQPLAGDFRARQIAVFTGAIIILAITWLSSPWLGAASTSRQLRVGCFWVILTILFEIGLGRVVLDLPWERILSDYDPSRGGLLAFGLIVLLVSPVVAARARGSFRG